MHPKAQTCEKVAFLWNAFGRNMSVPRFYVASQITHAEHVLGISRKCSSTTASCRVNIFCGLKPNTDPFVVIALSNHSYSVVFSFNKRERSICRQWLVVEQNLNTTSSEGASWLWTLMSVLYCPNTAVCGANMLAPSPSTILLLAKRKMPLEGTLGTPTIRTTHVEQCER
jgi:hypothetical protein